MRPASSALIAFLASGQPFWTADLFTFTLLNGNVLRLASSDIPITYSGNTWAAVGPAITRSTWSAKNTIDVPTLDMTLWSTGTDLNDGQPVYNGGDENIKQLIHNGLLDGSLVTLQRAFMPQPGDTAFGLVTLFGGKAGPITIGARGAKLTYKGANVKMQAYMPRNTYKIACIHSFCDAGCTLSAATFTFSNYVSAGSTKKTILWGGTAPALTNLPQGYVTFTSGPNDGEVRTIVAADSSGFTLAYPLYQNPVAGDTFTTTQGCNKTEAKCKEYGNDQNFRGFRFIPPATQGL